MQTHTLSVAPLPSHRAFTLIELLTVIAIIGILAAIIIPVAGRVRDSARTAQCLGNLRQISAATLLYCNDHKGRFPTRDGDDPASPKPWNQTISAYLGVATPESTPHKAFHCPMDPNPWSPVITEAPRSYRFSGRVSGGGSNPRWGIIGNGDGFSRNLSDITLPSRVAMICDMWTSNAGAWAHGIQAYDSANPGRSLITTGWDKATGAPRLPDGSYYHGGGKKINITFVDGHAASLDPDVVCAGGNLLQAMWKAVD